MTTTTKAAAATATRTRATWPQRVYIYGPQPWQSPQLAELHATIISRAGLDLRTIADTTAGALLPAAGNALDRTRALRRRREERGHNVAETSRAIAWLEKLSDALASVHPQTVVRVA